MGRHGRGENSGVFFISANNSVDAGEGQCDPATYYLFQKYEKHGGFFFPSPHSKARRVSDVLTFQDVVLPSLQNTSALLNYFV